MKDNIKELPRFNAYSNIKYMNESRKNNVLLDNIFDYIVISVPLTLILWFIYYRAFYCLFEYEVSKYLRAYSFCLILFDLLIQGNIEYFTFLAIRALDVFFSFSVSSIFFSILTIFCAFIVFGCTICSYWTYYYQYHKLGRYFLSNMYRFKSSYVLMTITYGCRPFLKGLAHAMFFENWNLQIWVLIGIEVSTLIIIVLFEIVLDNHKSRLTLLFEILYSLSLVGMNVLLLLKHEYFASN